MDAVATLPLEPAGAPWPWVLTFVLLGWLFLAIGLCDLCAAGCGLSLAQQGHAQSRSGTSGVQTSFRDFVQANFSVRGRPDTGVRGYPGRGKEPLWRFNGATKRAVLHLRRGCVYSTHSAQVGSPDLVRAMACRARPIMMDLARGNKSASLGEGSPCYGHGLGD